MLKLGGTTRASIDRPFTWIFTVDESMPEIGSSFVRVAFLVKDDFGIQYLTRAIVRFLKRSTISREMACPPRGMKQRELKFDLLREIFVLPDKFGFRRVKNDFTGMDAPDSLFRIQDLQLLHSAVPKQFLGKLRKSDVSHSSARVHRPPQLRRRDRRISCRRRNRSEMCM